METVRVSSPDTVPKVIRCLLSRGGRREGIFKDDVGRRRLLDALGPACKKTVWLAYAYCPVPNHFHLVVCWLRPLNDLEMDGAAAQDGRMDLCVKLPGRRTPDNGLVSKVMTDPFTLFNHCCPKQVKLDGETADYTVNF